MAPPDARFEIWFSSMDEVSVFTEVPGEGFDGEVIEAKLFAAFAAEMIRALGNSFESGYLADTLRDLPQIGLDESHVGELKIVPATPTEGRKGFEGSIKIGPDDVRIGVKAKGFGLLSRGVGYFAPMAVFALILTLHGRQSPQGQFVLVQTAEGIGQRLAGVAKISVRERGQAAAAAVDSALVQLDAAGLDESEPRVEG